MQTLPQIQCCEALKLGFQNYAKFTGRSRRSEFFYFFLNIYIIEFFSFIIFSILIGNEEDLGDSDFDLYFLLIPFIFYVVTIIPQIAITVRRLHDTGRSSIYFLSS